MTVEREPVVLSSALAALFLSIVPLGELFGWWHMSPDQIAGIELAILAVGKFAETAFARSKVTPVAAPNLPAQG